MPLATEINVTELLKLGQAKLGPQLARLTKAQVQALLNAEKAEGVKARSTVLRLLTAELDARAAELSPESVEQIAKAVHGLHSCCRAVGVSEGDPLPAWDELGEAERADHFVQLQEYLTVGASIDPANAAAMLAREMVATLVPLFNQIEALAAVVDHAPERETVGPGSLAEKVPPMDDKAQGKLLDLVASLAFCEGDVIRFKIKAGRADFAAVEGLPTRFLRRVVLERKKPRVRIDAVVALDAEGRPIARVTWPRPLEGGGGREAVFQHGSIAFAL